MHRGAHSRLIVFKILSGNEAAVPFHFFNNQPCSFPFVKTFHAIICNTLQGVCQFRLTKTLAGLPGGAVFLVKSCLGCGPALKPLAGLFKTFAEALRNNKTIPGKF